MEEVIRKETILPGSPEGAYAPTVSIQDRDQWVAEQMAEKDTTPDEQKILLVARKKQVLKMLIPFIGIFAAYAIHMILPNVYPQMYTPRYWAPFLLICAGVYGVLYVFGLFIVPVRKKLSRYAFLLCFVFFIFEVLDIATLKTGTLLLPFIPSPDKILEQFVLNFETILSASVSSLQLLAIGFVIGVIVGLFSGIISGCSRIAGYWISPLLKIIGPVPGLLWLPVLFVLFSSSRIASIAIIVLAVWFPLTLMLSNAIKNTDIDYIERAQTLGASRFYLIMHVMIPAAIPAITNGLFMALAQSFGALATAELCGVGAGLALAVKQMGSIANYGVVFAYVIMMVLIFSTLTMIMFAVRNWLLRWQKGLVRW